MSSIFMCLKSRIISKNMSLFLNVATLSRIWFLGILLSAYWYPVTLNARKTYQLGRGGPSQQKECNTLVLSMHLALAFHEHKHHQSIHEHEHMEFHLILYILSHVMVIIYIHMLVIMCDQCKRWLWCHKNTLDISRMVNGTMFVFMTWANFASNS